MVNLDELLQPVTADAPGGANLEYSPEFAALERTASGKPERQVGALVAAAEEPDWRAVVDQSSVLLKSTKDLRVANHLLRALVRVNGFAGLADGVHLLRELVDKYWDVLHPQLDSEDADDPTLRVNAMAALTHRDTLQMIRAAPLFHSKVLGAVTLREVEAAGTSNGQPPSAQAGALETAFQEVPLDELILVSNAVERCADEARGLAEGWNARLDGVGPDFTEFRKVVANAGRLLKGKVADRQPSVSATLGGGDGQEPSANSVTVDNRPFLGGAPRSREEVLRALDGICAYYARNEPSSPVPLLLERCKRLVTMSFLDIVKDMLPDGMATIQTIAGKRNE
jgi:type VI secretion system protein ImpA